MSPSQNPSPSQDDLTETPGWASPSSSTPDPEWFRQGQPTTELLSTGDGRPPTGTDPIRASTRSDEPKAAPRLGKLSQAGLAEAVKATFYGVGEGLNRLTAEDRTPYEDPDDIWIPTDEESEGVGEPTGRLLARRLPDLPNGDANDAADLIAALIPLGLWAFRNGAASLVRWARRRRANVPGQVVAPETEAR